MRLFTVITVGLLASTVALADATQRPNVVLILADDLGIGDVNCYGGDRCLIDTPHIDALAREGMRFTDAHVNASHCRPTRQALMTGRYNWRFGPPVHNGPWGYVGPRPGTDRFTLGKLVKGAGYRTAYVGKWHLGTIMTTVDGQTQGPENVDYSQPLKYGPRQFGFDESFILPGSLDMFPYAFIRDHRWQGKITARKGWSAFNRVGPAAEDFEDEQVLERFNRESEAFIRKQPREQPFFLFLALTAPHTPISPSKAWQGKSTLGLYGDFVMQVDYAVSRVREALQQAGHAENTLILFSSDHGAASYAGNIRKATADQVALLEQAGHYPSGPHRGYKFSVYEGGLRVPLVAHWPGVVPANSTCDALVGLNDVVATLAEIVDRPLDEDQGPDSISFAPLLHEPSGKGQRQTLIMRSVTSFVVRDGGWKLCLCPGSGTMPNSYVAAGNDPMPEVAWRGSLEHFSGRLSQADLLKPPFVQLFYLPDDPHEDHNLASDHPHRVQQMIETLQREIEQGRSTPGPKLDNDNPVQLIEINRLPGFVKQRLVKTRADDTQR